MQTFLFSDVLHALDMKAPALRRWIQLGLIGSTAKGKARAGWVLEFSQLDLAVLALVKPMAEFGVPISAAHDIAVRELREFAGPFSGDEPADAFWSAWAEDTQVAISRAVGKGGKPAWGVARFENATPAFSPVYLTLYPRALIQAALERAMASAEARKERRSA